MKLSILVCSLEQRKHYLSRLKAILDPQMNDQVEVLIEADAGQKSIGLKRNILIDRAAGDYIAFVDDDDRVSGDYVGRILGATKEEPDCVGMEGIITFNGRNPKKFIHSLRYNEWFERNGVYFRNPNHLSPVRRDFAMKTKFKEINNGEDHDYSQRIFPLLKKEVYLEGPIYYYDFRNK